MGRVGDPERHEQVFDFFSVIHADAVSDAPNPHVGWILEEGDGWSPLENGLEEGDLACMGFKHAGR